MIEYRLLSKYSFLLFDLREPCGEEALPGLHYTHDKEVGIRQGIKGIAVE